MAARPHDKHQDTCVIDAAGPRRASQRPGQEQTEDDGFVLRMMTVNCTSWHSLKALVMKTDANLIFAQEHKMSGFDLSEGTRWCEAQGWTSIWQPALVTKGKRSGSSGGVLIMARWDRAH